MSDPIKERDLPLVTPAPTDEVRVLRNGRPVRALALSLPTPPAAQAQIDSLRQGQQAGMLGFATKAAMDGDLARPAGTLALVTNDPTPANNRPYRKTGASGSGSWVPSEDRTTEVRERVEEIADESGTFYYEGDEVFHCEVDSEERPAVITLTDGRVKIPKLVLGPDQQDQIVGTAAAAVIASAWPRNALEALAFASRRPVDLVMIGDSNQAMNGYGYGSGLHKALAARFGCYATGVGAAAPSAYSEYTNNTIETLTPMSAGAYTGAGSAADAIVPPHQRLGYSFWASGELVGGTTSGVGRIRIKDGGGLDPSNPLRVHYAWISADEGSGSFRVGARLAVSPYTGAASGSLHNTNTGEVSLHRDTLDIPAGSRSGGLEIWWARPGQTPITGPMCAVSMRVEDTAKATGVAVSTFYAVGGQSLYDMAEYALTAPDGTLSHWFGEVRRLQVARGHKPIVVFYINSGLNDRNETSSPSLGWRGSTDPDGPDAYLDNLDALVKRIRDIWQKNGWAQDELFFLLVPSHPVSAPDDAELRSYRGACVASYAAQLGVSVVDMTNITSATEILAEGWYQSGGSDTNHLENAGYDELSARIVAMAPELDA